MEPSMCCTPEVLSEHALISILHNKVTRTFLSSILHDRECFLCLAAADSHAYQALPLNQSGLFLHV